MEAVGGGTMGATASSPASSWGQGPGCRVEGGEESEMGMQASLEGAVRVVDEVHGSSGAWPAILGVVASRGRRGEQRTPGRVASAGGCQGEGFWAIPGAREWVWSGARRVGRPVGVPA